MNFERLSSGLLSLCLHLGLLVLVLFWPAPKAPLLDPSQGRFIPDIVTLGKSGKDISGGKQAVPEAAKGRLDKAPPIEKPKADKPEPAPPAKVETPLRTEPRPEVKPVAKPVEKPVEKPAPDTVAIPRTPEKPPPKNANATRAATSPKPAANQADKTGEQPKKHDDSLGSALADLSSQVGTAKGRTEGKGTAGGKGQDLSSALAELGKKTGGSAGSAASGQGPGGDGGDGYGILGAYQDAVVSRVRPNWFWPGRADRKNYTTVVNIQIQPDGSIKNARIVSSSGNPFFDATVVQAIAATTNLEPPPNPDCMDMNIRFTPELLGSL